MKIVLLALLLAFPAFAEPQESITAKLTRSESIPADSVYSQKARELLAHSAQERAKAQAALIAAREADAKIPVYSEKDVTKRCATSKPIAKARMTESDFAAYKANPKRCMSVNWIEFVHPEIH